MASKLQKWGNSLGLRIPKNMLDKLNLSENSEIEINYKNGSLVITPLKKKFLLDELIQQINLENLHQEIDIKPVGREVW